MSANVRGAVTFAIMIAAAIFFCGVFPTVILPGWGIAMALPVIQVPGEYLISEWPHPDYELTNTIISTLIADFLVLLLAFAAYSASKGWTNEVPGKFQAFVESIVEGLYGLVTSMAGATKLARTQLFPLVATIFLFLLFGNWQALIPGVDSIGFMHCAYEGKSGYARNGIGLFNESPGFTGFAVENADQYHECERYLHIPNNESVAPSFDEATEMEIDEVVEALKATDLVADARVSFVEEYEELTGYHHVTNFPTAEQLENGVQPYSFVVTPWIRVAATDMNVVFALGIIALIAIQYFGVAALGIGYFQKFVNINALGNAGKRPMGIMDFGVGLFEIVSEFAKGISLAFRLFGNIFAGQLLLFIITFLVATLLPVAIYGLEFAVGMIQAGVFAMLTLVFSAQAMVSHHHDDDHDDHDH